MGNFTTKLEDKVNLKDKHKGISERLDVLEHGFESLEKRFDGAMTYINDRLGDHPKRLDNLENIISALIEIGNVSQEDLKNKIIEQKRKMLEAQIQANKVAISEAVANGHMLVADSIEGNDLVIGVEKDANGLPITADKLGNPILDGWVELLVGSLDKQGNSGFKELILGKKVGDVVQLGGRAPGVDGSFEVLEIYRFNKEKFLQDQQDKIAKTIEEIETDNSAANLSEVPLQEPTVPQPEENALGNA